MIDITWESSVFNLIVKYAGWVEGRDTIASGRTLEHTDPHLEAQFAPGGKLDIAAVSRLPTLFMQESWGDGNQVARVGSITAIHVGGNEIGLEFVYDPNIPPISNESLQEFAGELGIGDWEFSRTHWAIKSADLFRSLIRNVQPRRQQPRVFRIDDPERIEPTLVSAMMPFNPNFDGVYTKLQEIAVGLGLRCRRADDIWENPEVIQDVVSLIDHSRIVICDCTGRNPNVFYEIGIAHTLGREVILITQSPNDIPFDLRHLRYIPYLNNGEGLEGLAAMLRERMEYLIQ